MNVTPRFFLSDEETLAEQPLQKNTSKGHPSDQRRTRKNKETGKRKTKVLRVVLLCLLVSLNSFLLVSLNSCLLVSLNSFALISKNNYHVQRNLLSFIHCIRLCTSTSNSTLGAIEGEQVELYHQQMRSILCANAGQFSLLKLVFSLQEITVEKTPRKKAKIEKSKRPSKVSQKKRSEAMNVKDKGKAPQPKKTSGKHGIKA